MMSEEDDDEIGSTFQTEVDFRRKATSFSATKLPPIINVIAIRETFLSEAPFVGRNNKTFWRKMIDSQEYQGMFIGGYNFVHSCLGENGSINVDKLYDIKDSELIRNMSSSLAAMFFQLKRREKDNFFNRLPELLCFMIINSLHTSTPKQARLFNSIKFREILLDWINEMIGGVRMIDVKKNREWIFADATEATIITTNSYRVHGKAYEAFNKSNGDLTLLSSAKTSYSMEHSPLMNVYLDTHNPGRCPSNRTLTITLSHIPDRPLVNLNDGSILKLGKIRDKTINSEMILSTVRQSKQKRKKLMDDYSSTRDCFKEELKQLREALKTNLAVLANKPVSAKRLVAAMAASSLAGAGPVGAQQSSSEAFDP